MKSFIIKTILVIVGLIFVELALLEFVPKDTDNYLYEYKTKLELLKNTQSPKVVVVGGSGVAFNTVSPMIADSLGYNVVNYGLHAGIGVRYPISDVIYNINQGDIVVIQIEYGDFFEGGEGEVPTLTSLMVFNGWNNWRSLNIGQWKNIVVGIPKIAHSNLKRLINYPSKRTWSSTRMPEKKFEYTSHGFNKWGDEVCHFNFSNESNLDYKVSQIQREPNKRLLDFLSEKCALMEGRGATVIMLPPACIKEYVKKENVEAIVDALDSIGYPYQLSPLDMALDYEYFFDSKYHCNYQGAIINTSHIIESVREVLSQR